VGAGPASVPVAAPATRVCLYCKETIDARAARCPCCKEKQHRILPRSRMRRRMARRRGPASDGTGILLMGIVGWVICGFLLPLAWSMGAAHERECRAAGVEPSGAATTGKILGMVGTIVMGLGVLAMIVLVLAGKFTLRGGG
jgi:hypothetical protein